MADPPFDNGANHVKDTRLFPGVAVTLFGAPGTVAGVTDANVAKAPIPAAEIAAILN